MKKREYLVILAVYTALGIFFAQKVFSAEETKAKSFEVAQKQIPPICVLGKQARHYPFYVYKDGNSAKNQFFATGLMGDFSDVNVDLYNKEDPCGGTSSVKIIYKAGASRGARWSGLYWQYPANNWGEMPEGFDLRKAKRLTFWAKGQKGGEVINTFQVGGVIGKFGDTAVRAIGPVTLSNSWQKYSIDLSAMDGSIIFSRERWECWPFMEPLSRIIGGFGWATSLDLNSGSENIVFIWMKYALKLRIKP